MSHPSPLLRLLVAASPPGVAGMRCQQSEPAGTRLQPSTARPSRPFTPRIGPTQSPRVAPSTWSAGDRLARRRIGSSCRRWRRRLAPGARSSAVSGEAARGLRSALPAGGGHLSCPVRDRALPSSPSPPSYETLGLVQQVLAVGQIVYTVTGIDGDHRGRAPPRGQVIDVPVDRGAAALGARSPAGRLRLASPRGGGDRRVCCPVPALRDWRPRGGEYSFAAVSSSRPVRLAPERGPGAAGSRLVERKRPPEPS